MRRFVIVLLACALGLGVAFVFAFVADIAHPCGGEQLSCSITNILGLIYTPVFALIALIAYAVAVFWKSHTQALTFALLIPLVPFVLFFGFVKYSEISVREWHEIRDRDIQETLRIFIPIVLTLVVPWATLLRFAGPLQLKRNQHG